jgi:hypothetical protein
MMAVYVIAEPDNGPVKIGIAEHPEKRVNELQIGNPRKLSLYHSVTTPHAKCVEAALHRLFWSERISGEWFSVSAEQVVSAVEELRNKADAGHLSKFARSKNLRETIHGIERLCGMCGEWKRAEQYHPSKVTKHGMQTRCKTCAVIYQRQYATRPGMREKHNATERKRRKQLRASKEKADGTSGTLMQKGLFE